LRSIEGSDQVHRGLWLQVLRSLRWQNWLPALTLFAGLILIWQLAVDIFNVPPWLLPAPSDILQALWNTRELLWDHSKTTVVETLVGFTLAVILGVAVGICLSMSTWLKRLFYPFLIVSQTIPLIAIAPLLILWLGYGVLPKIVIVVLMCFFPIALNLIEGLDVTDSDLLNLLKSMGATRWQMLRYIQWPHALPSLFAGLKIAATYSVMAAVVGEWLGANSGLGVYLTRSSRSFLTDQVFASIVAIVVLSFMFFGLIHILRRIVVPWDNSK